VQPLLKPVALAAELLELSEQPLVLVLLVVLSGIGEHAAGGYQLAGQHGDEGPAPAQRLSAEDLGQRRGGEPPLLPLALLLAQRVLERLQLSSSFGLELS